MAVSTAGAVRCFLTPAEALRGVSVTSYLARMRPPSGCPVPQVGPRRSCHGGRARSIPGSRSRRQEEGRRRLPSPERSSSRLRAGPDVMPSKAAAASQTAAESSETLCASALKQSRARRSCGDTYPLPPLTHRTSPTKAPGMHGGGSVPNGTSFKRGVTTGPRMQVCGCRKIASPIQDQTRLGRV